MPDTVFLVSDERLFRDVVEKSPKACLIGDCSYFEKLKAGKDSAVFDVSEHEKHSKACSGMLDSGKIRRFELIIVNKSREFPVIAMANMEKLFAEHRGDFIRMFHAVARRKSEASRVYLLADKDMVRELAFFADRIMR